MFLHTWQRYEIREKAVEKTSSSIIIIKVEQHLKHLIKTLPNKGCLSLEIPPSKRKTSQWYGKYFRHSVRFDSRKDTSNTLKKFKKQNKVTPKQPLKQTPKQTNEIQFRV